MTDMASDGLLRLEHPRLIGTGQAPDTLVELFTRRTRSARTITLVEARGNLRTVSLSQLGRAAHARLADWQHRGVAPGEAVILLCEDRLAFLEAFWAATLGGLVPVPVSGGISDEHRLKVLRIATRLDEPWLFTDEATLERLTQTGSETAQSGPGATADALNARRLSPEPSSADPDDARVHTPRSDDPALIQFSSGSTSTPKGVVLSHRNVLVNLDAILHGMHISDDDRMMSWMPLTHDMGLIGFHLVPVTADIDHLIMATDVFVRRPTLWLSIASEHRATVLCSPNFGYAHFLKSFRPEKSPDLDLAAVRLVFNGAEPISIELIDKFNAALAPFGLNPDAMFPVYGLAESSLAVSFPPVGRPVRQQLLSRHSLGVGQEVQQVSSATGSTPFVSTGVCVPHVEVRIATAEGRSLAEDHVGHVLIRGANVTRGYLQRLGNPALDRSSIDAADWLDTGDLGLLSDGELYVTGRAKDIVFANGQNLYPHDLENTLIGAGVLEAGKLAIAARPGQQGDELCVFVLHRGAADDFNTLRDDIRRELAVRAGARVEHVVPVPRIPKTTSGKIQRFRLVEDFVAGAFDDALAALPEDTHGAGANAEANDASHDGADDLSDDPSPGRDALTGDAQAPGAAVSDAATAQSVRERLLQICNTRITGQGISDQDNLFELGISSLTLAGIHADMESVWPGQLDITDLFDYPTVAEIAEVLEQRGAQGGVGPADSGGPAKSVIV